MHGRMDTVMADASSALTQHLNDVRMEVAIGVKFERPIQNNFIPTKELSETERQCIAHGNYLLILGETTRPYLDALIGVVLSGEGSTIDKIAAWTSAQTNVYTYFPSELTLTLAQRLM
jgi:hypothetical protein|tara:strand:- start:229 stop:582 length:354 start_codon:yes stop_codon:yes gene_type:complete